MHGIYLILGPSGVGKSTVIDELRLIDSSFAAVPAYTTRPPRPRDPYRITLSESEFQNLLGRERLLAVNSLYGHRYGTSERLIREALSANQLVIIDCPVHRVHEYRDAFPGRVYTAYLVPPSIGVLRRRLANDRRDAHDHRLEAALAELAALGCGEFDHVIDQRVVAVDEGEREVAARLYETWRLPSAHGPERR